MQLDIDINLLGFHEFYWMETKEQYYSMDAVWVGKKLLIIESDPIHPIETMPCVVAANWKNPGIPGTVSIKRFIPQEFEELCLKQMTKLSLAVKMINSFVK